ncbi:winged helix-turn-helix transcriptional regulator [Marinoscillum furvescens]|uniref:HxlR family transcriptional regulator n=1 Tax=Marinoscillum furvescens DSM 4134 TaxID=1122208 RepID=A0A3D9L3V7_MARFU|nr:helix-turn-helix domain-containing protein [Marinoscillum furvescens]REE00139.1 HxlR family transcriptional regulator [Marinoscillum furvescens DSM 4134]
MKEKFICPLHYTMELIGSKWKPLLLFHLLSGPLRAGELQQSISGISNKMFTQNIRELERDGLVERTVFAEVPPRVEYMLTNRGKSLEHILRQMDEWGAEELKSFASGDK